MILKRRSENKNVVPENLLPPKIKEGKKEPERNGC